MRTRASVPSRIRRAVLVSQAAGAPRVPVHLQLASGSADDVIGACTLEEGEKRALEPARVRARRVARGDEFLGLIRQASRSWQWLRAPFPLASVFAHDLSSRRTHRFVAERGHQFALAVAVTVYLTIAAAVQRSRLISSATSSLNIASMVWRTQACFSRILPNSPIALARHLRQGRSWCNFLGGRLHWLSG